MQKSPKDLVNIYTPGLLLSPQPLPLLYQCVYVPFSFLQWLHHSSFEDLIFPSITEKVQETLTSFLVQGKSQGGSKNNKEREVTELCEILTKGL